MDVNQDLREDSGRNPSIFKKDLWGCARHQFAFSCEGPCHFSYLLRSFNWISLASFGNHREPMKKIEKGGI
jgi:hypothetical protein